MKWVWYTAAAIFALALVWTTLHILGEQHARQMAPRGRTSGSSPIAHVSPWERWMQQAHARIEETQDEGLIALIEAFEWVTEERMVHHDYFGEVSQDIAVNHWATLNAICRQGWLPGEHEEIVALIEINREALGVASRAARVESIDFPPMIHDFSPQESYPPFEKLDLIVQLMVAEGQRLTATGDPDTGAQWVIDAMRLAAHFSQRVHPFIRHSAERGLRLGADALEGIISHPEISESTLREIEQTLQSIEATRVDISEIVAGYLQEQVDHLRSVNQSEASREEFLSQFDVRRVRDNVLSLERLQEEFEDLVDSDGMVQRAYEFRMVYQETFEDFEAFAEDAGHYIELVEVNLSHTPRDRERMDREWTEDHTEFEYWTLMHRDFAAVVFLNSVPEREHHLVTRLRLLQALCGLCLREEERLDTILDPFTDEPLRVSPERVWSLGPDGVDQGGEIEVDLTTDLLSWEHAGDVVVNR
jgi:hypothetical protein